MIILHQLKLEKKKVTKKRRSLLFASLGNPLASRGDNNLSFEDRNLHNVRELTELLPELLHLVVAHHNRRAVAEVEGVVPRPHVHHILLLGPTRRHHQLSVTVHLRIPMELRVYVLLPAPHPTLHHSRYLPTNSNKNSIKIHDSTLKRGTSEFEFGYVFLGRWKWKKGCSSEECVGHTLRHFQVPIGLLQRMRLSLRTDIAYVVVPKWAFPFGPTTPLSFNSRNHLGLLLPAPP